jgi:nitrite reductase/ring-hydroxylating ferredoxin subunit
MRMRGEAERLANGSRRKLVVAPVSEMVEGTRVMVAVDGMEIGVLNHRGSFHAFENRCLHQGGPVCEGVVLGRVVADIAADGRVVDERFDDDRPQIVCPWHGWEYDLTTGQAAGAPHLALRRFDVVVEDDDVVVLLDDGGA